MLMSWIQLKSWLQIHKLVMCQLIVMIWNGTVHDNSSLRVTHISWRYTFVEHKALAWKCSHVCQFHSNLAILCESLWTFFTNYEQTMLQVIITSKEKFSGLAHNPFPLPPQMTRVKNCCNVCIHTVFSTSVKFKPVTFRALTIMQTIELNYCSFMGYDLIIHK